MYFEIIKNCEAFKCHNYYIIDNFVLWYLRGQYGVTIFAFPLDRAELNAQCLRNAYIHVCFVYRV